MKTSKIHTLSRFPLRDSIDPFGHWARRVGEWVRVHLSMEVEGKTQFIGRLVSCDENSAVLAPEDGTAEIRIPFTAVQLARVDVRIED